MSFVHESLHAPLHLSLLLFALEIYILKYPNRLRLGPKVLDQEYLGFLF